MKEYLAEKKTITKTDGSEIEVSYFIVSEELTGEDGQPVCECYGISLCSSCGERAMVRTVTVSLRQIESLLRMLARNEVLPMELSEAIENCIDQL